MPSKRFKKLKEIQKETNSQTIDKLIPIVKKNCTTKFDEAIDLSFQINNKQKKVRLIFELLLICQVEQEKKSKLQ